MKYKCPKCENTDTHLQSSGVAGDTRAVLRCRCGLWLFVTRRQLEALVYVPPPPPVEAEPANDQPPTCAWHECEGAPRENSKYCSRTCSNKNARHRWTLRRAS